MSTADKLIASVKEVVNASNAGLADMIAKLEVAVSSMTARLEALEHMIGQTNEKRPVRTAAPKAAKPDTAADTLLAETKTKCPANSLLFFKELIANDQVQREKYSTDEYAALVEGANKWPKNFDHSKKDATYWKTYANILWGLLDKVKKDEIKSMFEACKSQQKGTEELPLEADE